MPMVTVGVACKDGKWRSAGKRLRGTAGLRTLAIGTPGDRFRLERCCMRGAIALFGLFLATLSVTAKADTQTTPASSDSAWARAQGHLRAGCPQQVRPWAVPSNTSHYYGYYLGGGTAFRRELRFCNEGTWGWDYGGILIPKRIHLGWSHGRRYQGGTGRYSTAGPSPLPAE
jgi:hypothetical protein